MKKTFLKIIGDEIKSSFGRFAAIFSIVALSIGFLSGLLVTTPDMKATADLYYDDNNAADIFIKATKGLTQKDIDALNSVKGMDEIMPAYVMDSLMNNENEVLTAKIFGIPLLKKENIINNLQLVEGRMIQNNNECLVEKSWGSLSDIKLNSKLTISQENENYENISDTYNVLEYTVVGIVENPFYFSVEKERSTIGSGTANALVYVDESSFSMDVYTDFFIKVKDSEQYTAFTDDYETYVEDYVDILKELGKKQSVIRIDDIKTEAYEEINDAKKEYEEAKLEADTELSDAAVKIANGKSKLSDAALEIQDGKIKLKDARETLQKEKADAEADIKDGYEKLSEGKAELEDGEIKYADGINEPEEGKAEYTDGLIKFLEAEDELQKAQSEFNVGEQKYLDGVQELEEGKEKIKEGSKKLSSGKRQLLDAESQYQAGVEELEEQKQQFNSLTDQIMYALSSSGLQFASREELLYSVENEETGMVSGAVTSVLSGMRNALSGQISVLESQRSELENNIHNLELLIENLSSETVPDTENSADAETDVSQSSGNQSVEELQNQINALKEQQQILNVNINVLQLNYNMLPDSFQSFIYGYNALKQGEQELADAAEQIASGWDKYYDGRDKLNEAKEEIKEAEEKLNDAKEEIEENRIKLQDAWAELEEGRLELADASSELKEGIADAENARKDLDDGWAEYYDGLIELKDAESTLKNEVAKAEREIKDGEKDLAEGQIDYQEGLSKLIDNEIKFLDAKKEAETKLSDAAVEIADAEKEIAELETPEWYVLDRNSNVSYASFSANAGKVADVAKVFPIFFFLIAALVTLTTMTRMVEEERTQIGTLKALGYKKKTIISKYLIYSGLASTLGSVAGVLIGFKIFPSVIWNAYRSMYNLPDLTNQILWQYALPESLLIIILTIAVTYNVCSSSLKEKPATLMLPKAPKAGKRIFLERIDFIWSRMKFSHKSTARNIMRYKKHLFMTVIGISGCAALMVTGFGMLDSIGSIANTQFTELFKYDLNVELEDVEQYDEVLKEFLNDSQKVKDYATLFTDSGYVMNKNEKISATIKVPQNSESLINVIDLRDRNTKISSTFDDSSVVITEKLAEIMGIKVGESLTLENGDGERAEFVLSGTTENYVGCYIYINKNDYENAFKKEIQYNTILLNTVDSDVSQEEYISELLQSDSVMNVEPVTQIKKSFDSLLSNMEYIVVVIILASGILAVIVLYNLTNININERRKELSTLKVLGYHNEEVASYVFRETAILSIMGTLMGLPLGVYLHAFVIKTVEAVNLMMGRTVSLKSFVYSVLITLIFAMLVNLIMYRKVKKIEMVESMKAID